MGLLTIYSGKLMFYSPLWVTRSSEIQLVHHDYDTDVHSGRMCCCFLFTPVTTLCVSLMDLRSVLVQGESDCECRSGKCTSVHMEALTTTGPRVPNRRPHSPGAVGTPG